MPLCLETDARMTLTNPILTYSICGIHLTALPFKCKANVYQTFNTQASQEPGEITEVVRHKNEKLAREKEWILINDTTTIVKSKLELILICVSFRDQSICVKPADIRGKCSISHSASNRAPKWRARTRKSWRPSSRRSLPPYTTTPSTPSFLPRKRFGHLVE